MGPGMVVPPGGWLRTFSSLRIRNYRWYWTGIVASSAAMQMGMIARGWVVAKLTDSSWLLGLVNSGFAIPFLMFSLFGGVVADRVEKRNLLIVTQAAIGFISIAAAIMVFTGFVQWWHLFIVSIFTGFVFAFNFPARQAFIPELVGEGDEALMNAIALNSGAMNAMRMAGPALAGQLIALIGGDDPFRGGGGVYFVVVGCYVLQIITLLMIPISGTVELRANVPMREELTAGLSTIRRNTALLTLMILAFAPILFGMPYMMLLPLFAINVFGVGSAGYGLLSTLTGAGALVGSLVIASLGDFRRKGLLLLVLALIFGLGLMAFSSTSSYHLALFFLLFVGIGGTGYMTLNNTLVMTNTPHEVRGRVMSVYMMTWGLMPMGTLPAGAIAEVVGVQWVIGAGGAILALLVMGMTLASRTVRQLE